MLTHFPFPVLSLQRWWGRRPEEQLIVILFTVISPTTLSSFSSWFLLTLGTNLPFPSVTQLSLSLSKRIFLLKERDTSWAAVTGARTHMLPEECVQMNSECLVAQSLQFTHQEVTPMDSLWWQVQCVKDRFWEAWKQLLQILPQHLIGLDGIWVRFLPW